ncbi:MAG: hypothetical protein JOZ99_01985, partial [Actinobacteria bacterium]|nr:hypothetical protein [Actinomycetota bacterium]
DRAPLPESPTAARPSRRTTRPAPRRGNPREPRHGGGRRERADSATTSSDTRPAGQDLELLAEAEAAARAGDLERAVKVFRKLVYLHPDEPAAHLRLALALESAGHVDASTRAYRAARGALERSGSGDMHAVLEGYHIDELRRLLDTKLGAPR